VDKFRELLEVHTFCEVLDEPELYFDTNQEQRRRKLRTQDTENMHNVNQTGIIKSVNHLQNSDRERLEQSRPSSTTDKLDT
jgi:hypothetical protein